MPLETKTYNGFYPARVTEVDIDGLKEYGAIRVSLPDLMVEDIGKAGSSNIDLNKNGLIAFPANNPFGGRDPNDKETDSHFYGGCVYVPPKGSTVWVFFLYGNLEKPFYWNALNYKYSKLPPEQTSAEEPHKVYTVIKTRQGRTICVSDDENTQRVEITGKKRKLTGKDPAGNSDSTYDIDGNMNTILLDEREGKEKILIKTHKGDYIHIDIDQRKFHMSFENDIIIKTNGIISLDAKKGIDIHTEESAKVTADKSFNIKSGGRGAFSATQNLSLNSSAEVVINGIKTKIQSGADYIASPAVVLVPLGDRDD
jgi:hypothetical protein